MPGRTEGAGGLESPTGGQIVFEKLLAAFLYANNKQLRVVLSAPQADPLDSGPLPRTAGPLLAPKQPSPRSLNLEPRAQIEGPVCGWLQLQVQARHFIPLALGFPGCKMGRNIPALLSPRAGGRLQQ